MTDWTKERIEAELKACEAATPGPWTADRAGDGAVFGPDEKRYIVDEGCGCCCGPHFDYEAMRANMVFIATARTGYPDALRSLSAAQDEIARLAEVACENCKLAGDNCDSGCPVNTRKEPK